MAYYAALVSLMELLEDIIHRDRYPNFLLDKQQIASVYKKFSFLQQSLEDYLPKDEEAANCLERRIRDAAYQAQDIIESEMSNQIHPEGKITQGARRVVRHLISALLRVIPQQLQPQRSEELGLDRNVQKEYREIEKVKKEVDSIVEEVLRIKTSHETEDLQLNYYSPDAGTSKQTASGRNTTVGVEEYLTTIKNRLCGEPANLRIIPIVGMGGIGKTTFARYIFDDELILYHFDYRAWVTVSQEYYMQRILVDILKSLNVPIGKLNGVGELEDTIYKHLKGRKYLIIIDDIWDTEIWHNIKRILPDDSNGSRIMITTRIFDVASYASTSSFYHQMQFLNEDQSWNLFRAKVLCPSELEDIGRLIANNCQGLPLAIVVVAGLLSKTNMKRCDWEEIARNVSLVANENDEHFAKILSLSYRHLPHHLKACFLYMVGFPENYEIHVDKLIKLWVAEGFLKPIESKSLEQVGEEYLEDLVNRNLILITKKKFNGKSKCCGIHDFLRDLCKREAWHEDFLHVLDENGYFLPKAARKVRRFSIHPGRSEFTEAEECGSHVRSTICFRNVWNFLSFGAGFKLLRVLDAEKILLSSFPDEILELFHLRFLALSYFILPIPPSISKLHNLQTLILVSWPLFAIMYPLSLPSQILDIPSLRHIVMVCQPELSLSFDERVNISKASIAQNLQTLSRLANVRFTNQLIERIPNLQKLKVSYDGARETWQDFCLNSLVLLHQLETLSIQFTGCGSIVHSPFPEGFSFPQKLKKLSLRGCRLPWKDLTVVGSLPNLQILKLREDALVGEKWEPVEEEFPQLKFLLMERLQLKFWQAENTHFPRLKVLKIRYCRDLQDIPLEIGEITSLELIEVHYSESAVKSALQIQEEQQDLGNEDLQVRVYPQARNYRGEEGLEIEVEVQEEEAPESNEEPQEVEALQIEEEPQEVAVVAFEIEEEIKRLSPKLI